MEFGAVGFDGSSLVGSNNGFNSVSSDYETKQKCYGSGFLKHERSGFVDQDDWRAPKSAKKIDGLSPSLSTEVLLQSKCAPLRSTSVFSSDSQNMLSFSSPKSETFFARNNGPGFLDNSNYNNRSLENAAAAALPYFQHLTAATYSMNAGLGCCSGGLNANGTSMYFMDGHKGGLFTPSQFLELEHQALIFKYILANEPIPPHLLHPIRKALESAGFSAFSAGPFRTTSWGWSPFHLALSNNTDPEPGRCRRTDGKKWRCSRDAMPDQKYCERHMNRGRHRSRKPVEGQTNNGHPPTSAAAASATNTNNMNHLFTTSSSSSSHAVPPGAGTSNSFDIVSQRSTNLHSATNASPTASPFINRLLVNKQNSPAGLQDSARMSSYLVSPTTISNLSPGENSSLVLNGQFPFEQHHPVSSSDNFGVPASDSLLNKCTSFRANNNYYLGSTHDLSNQRPKPPPTEHSLYSSFKTQSSGGLWPELEPDQSDRDRTQLSISISMAPSDYMSSTSSPINEKTSSVSPLRLSREQPDSIQMGLGSSSSRHIVLNEPSQKTATWVPLTSMGGPLGEVLNNSSSNGSFSGEYCKKSSALNLLSKGWDFTCPQIVASSPTGVLHKAALRSLSNSSAGSSPRAAENSKSTGLDGGGSLCSDLLGSSVNLQHSSSLPDF